MSAADKLTETPKDSQPVPVEPSIVVSYPNDSGLVGHFRSNNGVIYKNGDRFYDQRTIDTLQSALQRVTEDAERYRWLRDNSYVDWDLSYENVQVEFPLDTDEFQDLDGAIDIARSAS